MLFFVFIFFKISSFPRVKFSGKGKKKAAEDASAARKEGRGVEEGAAELVVEPTTNTPAPAPGRANVDAAAMQEGAEKEYNFVIKSPPKMSFIRMVHKLSRPFFNEVSWYLDLVRGENKNKSSVDDMSESDRVASRIIILSNPCNKMCFGGCFRRLVWEFNISALILIF